MTERELRIAKHLMCAEAAEKGYNRIIRNADHLLCTISLDRNRIIRNADHLRIDALRHRQKAEELKLEGMTFFGAMWHVLKGDKQ